MLPATVISTVFTVALVTFEVILLSTNVGVLRFGAYLLILVHGAFAVNTLMQARVGVRDYLRCLRGWEPKYLTPERMARSARSTRRVSWIGMLFTISTPFFPLAMWAVFEVMAFQVDTVRQHVADISEAQHRVRDHSADSDFVPSDQQVLRASRAVVLGQASRGVWAPA